MFAPACFFHALVPGKRGAHLALSLERLEALRDSGRPPTANDPIAGRTSAVPGVNRPLQRIGLSATQRPLDEVARFLGGTEARQGRGAKAKGHKTTATNESRIRWRNNVYEVIGEVQAVPDQRARISHHEAILERVA